MASYAAVYGVPYERFAKAVQDDLSEREWAAQQGSLRGQYEGSRILFGPDHDTSSELEKRKGGGDNDRTRDIDR